MAGELILGAVVGAVAEELSNLILEKKDQAVNFRDHLERLQNSLELMAPLFTEGMQLDLEFNDRQNKGLQKLIAKLRGGEDLIQKCTKVPNWNIYLKMLYSSKIINLDEAILSFCQRELQAEMWRDNKQIMRGVQQFETKLEGQRELQVETWRGVQRLETTVEGLRESQVEIWRDSKQIMRGVQQLETTVEGLSTQLGRSVSLDVFSPGNEGLCAVPELPNCVVGLDVPLRELKIKLFKENVTVLGVCAPGGCGKSTLAAMLCRNEQVQCTFKDKILFLTVSRTPNLKILLRLLEKIGGRLPDSNLSEKDATKQFQYLLQQRKSEPLLLVLDDVWDKSIIEKLFSRTEGYKMLVTSREAFQIYNTEYHSKYLLKTLNHQDSKALFHHTAFFHRTALSQDGNEEFEPDEDLINEILRCCDGFPLAIMVIAKSLSLQPAVIWEKMARKLLKGCSILDFDENLRECLTTSLESLDATVLECFLDLGSFPEDKKVPASALIDMWCELYELEDEDDAYVNLLELASRNLINLVGSREFVKGIDTSYNELFVTQHDLLRNLAIYQSRQHSNRLIMDKREKGLPERWRNQENNYLNARLVSLHRGEMSSDSWYDLQLPQVEVLILNCSASNYALPPFMEKMRKLKVLIVVNHGRIHTKLTSFKTLSELAGLKRIRLEKVSIPSLHEFTMPLPNLQKISLVMCEVRQALMQCTINVPYVLPNLVEINIDFCEDLVELPSWICDIICLQTLSITNCHNLSALPERIGCITDLELLRLHACTGLSKLPDSIRGLQKLRFFDISDCFNLEMLPDGMCELRCLKKLDMRGCIALMELPPSAKNLVHLKEVICDEDTASLWEPLSSNLKLTVLKKNINLDWLGIDN